MEFPQELYEKIINSIESNEPTPYYIGTSVAQELLSCALVCRAWTRCAQQRIFSFVDIHLFFSSDGEDEDAASRRRRLDPMVAGEFFSMSRVKSLAAVLSTSTQLASFVTKLRVFVELELLDDLDGRFQIMCNEWLEKNHEPLTRIFDRIRSLEYLNISFMRCNLNEERYRPLYESIFHLLRDSPAVSSLSVYNTGFQSQDRLIMLIRHAQSLTDLSLDTLQFNDPGLHTPQAADSLMVTKHLKRLRIYQDYDDISVPLTMNLISAFSVNRLEELSIAVSGGSKAHIELLMRQCPVLTHLGVHFEGRGSGANFVVRLLFNTDICMCRLSSLHRSVSLLQIT
jgi:hypothetical protein